MILLLLGLLLFLGVHSARFLFDGVRDRFIAARGDGAWKGLYSILSLIGLVLIVVGYGQARLAPIVVWTPPGFFVHISWLLTWVAFVLLAATFVPRNPLRAAVGHPMVLGVKVWAFAHLLVNGTLADMLLFGSFLVWAIADFAASRRRDRRQSVVRTGGGGALGTLATVAAGTLAWGLFAIWMHAALIGVSPFGG